MTEQQASVLVVAAKAQNLELVSQLLHEHDYRPVTAASLANLDRLLAKVAAHESSVTMALVDADGFSAEIWERCKQFRAIGIPFILLSLDAASVERKGVKYGARSVIEKPIAKGELIHWIQTLTENV